MSLTGSLSNKPGTAIGIVTPISHAFAAVLAPMPRRLEPSSSPRLYIPGTTLFFHDQWLLTKTKTVDRPFKSTIENWANNVTISPSATTTSQTSSSCEHDDPPGEKAIVKSEPHDGLQPHRLYSVPSWLCKKYPTLDLNPRLPPGAENNNRFRRVFIPTFERWFGTRANPWVISNFVAIPVLQTIWDAVYMADGVEWTFEAYDPVIYCISQCLDEWSASFKSTAEIMVEEFFESRGESLKSSDARQEWAADMFHNFKFVFGEDEKQRLTHPPFIVRVFAVHLVRIAGAIDIDPAVEGVSSSQKYPPRGALALATAAVSTRKKVERVLQLWANGEMDAPVTVPTKRKFKKTYMKAAPRLNLADGNISKFSSDVWAAPTTNYYKSIIKMKLGSLEAIVKAANTFLSQARLRVQGSSVGPSSIADDDDDDLRACLVDDSDLDSGSE
ncbi:hypothetical protein EDB92DRAFT_665813 [Lactarius akahatsu]|uniref:Uncharacterized protein n=1 Tax=Lactarius akahatsu TaxID=416441 RepID=A0AAD4LHG5_9AGAM|nr:hypothetical protein EDB92DRAFT_665813 [Lactarius akahatsu]